MPIDLPNNPSPNGADAFFIDAGSWQQPIQNGSPARLDGLGDRHGLSVTLPPMTADDASEWILALNKGLGREVIYEWQQPGISVQGDGNGNVRIAAAAASQSFNIQINGFFAGQAIKKGRYFSIYSGGRYYLHQSDGQFTSVAGSFPINIFPRLRTPLAAQDLVNFNPPKFQGILQGNQNRWTISLARHVGLQFEIIEAE